MSMLQSFFEIGCDKAIFDGLDISREAEFCEEYMGKFPVISISLKGVEGASYTSACDAMRYIIGMEASRFSFLAEREKLTQEDKSMYSALVEVKNGLFTMSESVLVASLQTLTKLLEKHYGVKVLVLIDEYDVPLDKAFQYGYYDKMILLIRNMFSNVLKSNNSLFFAVLTGCLRISKESIFTGLNNLKIFSITNVAFDEYFGFTDDEVKELLDYYNLSEHYPSIREWYDGYQFGNVSIYCPWDVISHFDALCADPDAYPEDYWSNTSSNSIVRRFIDKADKKTKNEIEQLIEGKTILKEIRQDLTYNELDTSIENLWSVLFTTGYLTHRGRIDSKKYQLAIPNREVREIFRYQIKQWFQDTSGSNPRKLNDFCEDFPAGDAEKIEQQFNEYLWNSISIRDTFVKKERKDNFYHGILLGLLQYKTSWLKTECRPY